MEPSSVCRLLFRDVLSDPAVIVECFLNGAMGAAALNPVTGLWKDRYMRGRSDLVVLRSLANARRVTVAVRYLEG